MCWRRGASEFQKRTPLHYAAKSGHPDCMKLLLLYGADPNCTDEDGYTPIHYVCQMFKPIGRQKAEDICRCLKYLIDFGADIRARTKSSYTPMELALRHKNLECANELQKHGMGKKQLLCKENFSILLFFVVSSCVRAGGGASTGLLSPCGVWLDLSRLLVTHQGPVDTGIFKAVSD